MSAVRIYPEISIDMGVKIRDRFPRRFLPKLAVVPKSVSDCRRHPSTTVKRLIKNYWSAAGKNVFAVSAKARKKIYKVMRVLCYWTGPPHRGCLSRCLSHIKGNCHLRF